ncbi:MAG: TonB-dependent receptor [Flexistipes sinusarabici]|uniref:TonB-dependent receptor n=1 Tax=Flexistipes sinusarabici TaxID=2352 RepID=A0A5D0MP04_FLESI|nr:TonB-dependent receptor plug domain-containing protein [Flexistipes sinusarabici]TYB33220.1 MAG: TonB-dependent receptor [Flexistipes sinusarabici]
MRILTSIFFLLLSINIYAVTLEGINVFGEKYTKEDINKNPAVEIMTRDKIEQLSPSSTLDLLNYAAGLQIKSFNSASSSISMGGFVGDKAAFNNVILINGRQVNPVDMSSFDINSIPVEMIERVEIYYGPNSVLFGDRATGGAINIITRKPLKSGGYLKAEGGSYDTSDYFAQGTFSGENFSMLFNADKYRTDGYRDNGEYYKESVSGETTYYGEKFDIGLNGLYIDKEYGLPGGLSEADIDQFDREHSNTPDDGSEDYEWLIGGNAKLYTGYGNFILDVSQYKRHRDTDWVSFGSKRRDEIESFSVAPSYIYTIKNGEYSNKLIAGYSNSNTDLEVLTGGSELSRKKESFYISDTVNIHKILLEAGYRYSEMEDDYDSIDKEKDFDADAYFIKVGYELGENNFIYVKYDKSFRFPTTDEINEYSGLNSEIDEQTNKTYEIGFKRERDLYHFDALLYRQKSNDEIFTNPDYTFIGAEPANTNLDTKKTVFLVRFGLNRKNTVFDVAYTYTDSEIDEDPWKDNTAPLVSKHTVKTNLGYKFENGLGMYYFYRYFSDFYQGNDYGNTAGKVDGYGISDVKLSYHYRNIEAYVKINNIFDEEYSNYVIYSDFSGSSYYPAAERNYLAGVKITF